MSGSPAIHKFPKHLLKLFGAFVHGWWACKLEQASWRGIWQYVPKALNTFLPFDPVIPSLGIYLKAIIIGRPKDLYMMIFITAFFIIASSRNNLNVKQ